MMMAPADPGVLDNGINSIRSATASPKGVSPTMYLDCLDNKGTKDAIDCSSSSIGNHHSLGRSLGSLGSSSSKDSTAEAVAATTIAAATPVATTAACDRGTSLAITSQVTLAKISAPHRKDIFDHSCINQVYSFNSTWASSVSTTEPSHLQVYIPGALTLTICCPSKIPSLPSIPSIPSLSSLSSVPSFSSLSSIHHDVASSLAPLAPVRPSAANSGTVSPVSGSLPVESSLRDSLEKSFSSLEATTSHKETSSHQNQLHLPTLEQQHIMHPVALLHHSKNSPDFSPQFNSHPEPLPHHQAAAIDPAKDTGASLKDNIALPVKNPHSSPANITQTLHSIPGPSDLPPSTSMEQDTHSSTCSSHSNNLTRSKRSSSTSYDLIYERDRFRARLQQINMTVCDVCDGIGTKTTKLNVKDYEDSANDIIEVDSNTSPLDPQAQFFQNLTKIDVEPSDLDITFKSLTSSQLASVFKWYFSQPLPDTSEMFPWLHGLNKDNFAQKQFFLYQQHQLQESNIFKQYSLEKPKDIRFLMCINLDEDPKLDINHNFLWGSSSTNFIPVSLIKNTIKLKEVLQHVDISRLEVKHMIRNIFDDIFNIEDESIIDTFTNDCIKIKFLPIFLNLDPDRGVSLRNFHIQVSKLSTSSDFIIYGGHEKTNISSYARVLWLAQQYEAFKDGVSPQYNIFVYDGLVEQLHEDVVWNNDFQIKERIETTRMSSATKINRNVWVGNYWDYHAMVANLLDKTDSFDYEEQESHTYCDPENSIIYNSKISGNLANYLPKPKANWKLFMYCHNDATFPSLSVLSNLLFKYTISSHHDDIDESEYHLLEFPPSGSIGIGDCKKDNIMSILNTCKLIYLYSSSNANDPKVLSTLIYCSDGYTELSLFVLCYLMYSFNIGLADAMLKLHLEFGRPFYIFNSDVLILNKLEGLLNKFSPKSKTVNWGELETISNEEINELLLGPSTSVESSFRLGFIEKDEDEEVEPVEPEELTCNWVNDVEGSIPSQILPYVYLGSLKHANCLPLLNKLGIKKIISVGENLDWLNGSKFKLYNEVEKEIEDEGNIELFHIKNTSNRYPCSIDTVMKVNNLQDDGIDELSRSLPRILRFINDQYEESNGKTKILVHCRVGVSRSATVVIAEVMKRLNVTIADAYLYVRVRRLNIIIQPNLRFMYELFKWEEYEKANNKSPTKLRDIDWFIMCREIMKLNLPYLNN